jgi:aminoglycoside 3-N-acetyltransferase
LRGLQKYLQIRFVRQFRAYEYAELVEALSMAGIQSGDHLMLHASSGPEFGFEGSVGQAIDAFIEVLGADGTLFMVSMPYGSSTMEYLERGPIFDVDRTPSRMGLMSELFRRRPDVLRTAHPTHPVLGHGPGARAFLTGHDCMKFPCGSGSPFERMLAADGKVAFFNASLSTMTYFHYLEHLLAARLPFPIYAEPVRASIREPGGGVGSVMVCPFTLESIRRRRPQILQQWMREAGLIRPMRVGASQIIVLRLREVTDLVLAHADRGKFFYSMD